MAATTFDVEHTDFVTRDREVDIAPISFRNALPRYNNTLLSESTHAIFVRAKLRDSTRTFKFSLMVVLLGEGKKESLFPICIVLASYVNKLCMLLSLPFVFLQRSHSLLDVVIVALALLFQVLGFFV